MVDRNFDYLFSDQEDQDLELSVLEISKNDIQ